VATSPKWRDVLPVHPVADSFPLMSEPELRELGEDIKANGLLSKIIVYDGQLIDGRNRLDAMALVGIKFEIERRGSWVKAFRSEDIEIGFIDLMFEADAPYEGNEHDCVRSANLYRRHLNTDQKRDTIAKLLKAKPEASDRQIAKQTKSSPTTVGTVRKGMEQAGDVSKLDTRTDTKGRKQPSAKPKKPTAELSGVSIDVSKLGPKAQAAIAAQTGEVDVEARRAEMAALDRRGSGSCHCGLAVD
jgi:hypothetical protein